MTTEYPGNTFPEHDGAAKTPLFDEVTQAQPDTNSSATAGMADHAQNEAKEVAGAAKEKARDVAAEAKGQAKGLFEEATGELREQAGTQKTRAAEQLHAVGEQLSSMADSSDEAGPAVDLVRNLGSRAGAVASWLGDRDPDAILSDVRAYASRNPRTFIGIAAVAGIVAGRLTKSLAANAKDTAEETHSSSAAPFSPATRSTAATEETSTPEFGDGRAQSSTSVSAVDNVSAGWTTGGDTSVDADIDVNRRGESL